MSPMERQGRILLSAGIGVLFLSVFVSMVTASPFTYGFIFAAAVGLMGLIFFLRGR